MHFLHFTKIQGFKKERSQNLSSLDLYDRYKQHEVCNQRSYGSFDQELPQRLWNLLEQKEKRATVDN